MDADAWMDPATYPQQPIDRLSTRVYVGLREERLAADDVVALACELLDQGHGSDAVREVVERDPAQVPAAELADLARRILDGTTFEPGFDAAPERLELLSEALRVVARDLPADGTGGEPRLVPVADSSPMSAGVELPDGGVLLGNAGLHASMGAGTPAFAVAMVAEVVQEGLMEHTWAVWPLCAVHPGRGLHPDLDEGAAVWRCTGSGGHIASPIGELAQQVQGPVRRRR